MHWLEYQKQKLKKWKKSCGLQNYQWKKLWKSYLQQPTKHLRFKPNFESIQKFNSNRKAKQKAERESKADFQTNINSETDEDVSLRDSYMQTPEIIEKSKPDIFITEGAGFSVFWSKVLTSLRFKTNTLSNWKSMSYEKKERFLSWTALQNKDQVFRICCKTCNISKENWMFVMNMCIYNEYTCGICNE